MKVLLMHPEVDFELGRGLPVTAQDLIQDLELDLIFDAMAGGDALAGGDAMAGGDALAGGNALVRDVARVALLAGERDPSEIGYRQAVLTDFLTQPELARALYELATEAIASERRQWGLLRASPHSVLSRSLRVMELFVELLVRLRELAEAHADTVESAGLSRLFASLSEELSPDYFGLIEQQLEKLSFKGGTLTSVRLGPGNRGQSYMLRDQPSRTWFERISALRRSPYSFRIDPRDEAGGRAVSELADRGVNLAANALAQSVEHILSFFKQLQLELGFYIGCLNLHAQLERLGATVSMPAPTPTQPHTLAAEGLYDVSLTLRIGGSVVGSSVHGLGKSLIVITGANRGGKSTFLRSLGLAQLMMQAGMFVGADAFRANVRDAVFTHYKREEDETMESGRLVEELRRMSDLADSMTPASMLLCNESFSSTNEREASEIGRQTIAALTEAGVKVVFVTHLYELSHSLYENAPSDGSFLRADLSANGAPTFALREGEPLPTSHGVEIYKRVFGTIPDATVSFSRAEASQQADVRVGGQADVRVGGQADVRVGGQAAPPGAGSRIVSYMGVDK